VGTANTASGSTVHPYFCGGCGTRTQVFEKKAKAQRMGCAEKIEIEIQELRVCAVCGAQGAEKHHWALRFLFGNEADKWPTAMLCVTCHLRWHNVVTPHMCSKL